MTTGAVVLAAGSSTRMGQSKQLLPYRGVTLLEHAISQALQAGFAPVVTVLGSRADAMFEAVRRTSSAWVVSQDWASGMGESLKTGVGKVLQLAPDSGAIAVLLADQPGISARRLQEMKTVFEAGESEVVAASYAGTLGVPAIFRRTMFSKLASLPPGAGARWLLRGGDQHVEPFELPEAATDVDTPEDFAALS